MFNTGVVHPCSPTWGAARRPSAPLAAGAGTGAAYGAAAGATFGVAVAAWSTGPVATPEADLLGWAGLLAIFGPVGAVVGAVLGTLPGLLCGTLVALAAPRVRRHLPAWSVAVFLVVTVGGTVPVLLALADPGDDVLTALGVLCLPLPFAATALALHARRTTRRVWPTSIPAPAVRPGSSRRG